MSSETGKASSEQTEAELARQWNAENERDAIRARTVRLSLALVLVAVAIGLALLTLYGWAFIAFGLAATAFLMYLDANGHVHEIRERSQDKLVPRLADVLGAKQQREAMASDQPKPAPTNG